MKLKKMLALSLTAALCFGTAMTTRAAELDYEWYAAKNPDVVAEYGDTPEAMRWHYENFGRKEVRMANENDTEAEMRRFFNANEYAALYPDVKEAFGEDTEAMFRHYIVYGMLEARRPSDKVSYEAAVALKKAVVKELEKAGLATQPGLAPMTAIIEGNLSKTAGSAATEQILAQVTAAVDKAIADTIHEADNPPSKSSGSVTSSSGSSSGGSTGGGDEDKDKDKDKDEDNDKDENGDGNGNGDGQSTTTPPEEGND